MYFLFLPFQVWTFLVNKWFALCYAYTAISPTCVCLDRGTVCFVPILVLSVTLAALVNPLLESSKNFPWLYDGYPAIPPFFFCKEKTGLLETAAMLSTRGREARLFDGKDVRNQFPATSPHPVMRSSHYPFLVHPFARLFGFSFSTYVGVPFELLQASMLYFTHYGKHRNIVGRSMISISCWTKDLALAPASFTWNITYGERLPVYIKHRLAIQFTFDPKSYLTDFWLFRSFHSNLTLFLRVLKKNVSTLHVMTRAPHLCPRSSAIA